MPVGAGDGILNFVTNPDRRAEQAHYDAEYDVAAPSEPAEIEPLGQHWLETPYAPVNRLVWSRLGDLHGKTVLLLGNGLSCKELYFAGQTPRKLVVSDLSLKPLRVLKRHYGLHDDDRIVFAGIDAEELPFPDSSVSIVYGYAFVHHLPDVETFLRETSRVLEPGGRAVFMDAAYSPLWDGAKRTWLRLLMRYAHRRNPISEEDLRFTLAGGFPLADLAMRIRAVEGEPWFERIGIVHYLATRATEIFVTDGSRWRLDKRQWVTTGQARPSLRLEWRHERILRLLAGMDERLMRFRLARQNAVRLVWGFDKREDPATPRPVRGSSQDGVRPASQ